MSIPKVKFSNGKTIPILGLGTWKSKPGEVEAAVEFAIDAGYRHIDCAAAYSNEHEVGSAIKNVISKGKVTRGDLFITSKCWNTFHRREKVLECCKKTLADLGLEYVDLYLIHWPFAYKEGDELFPFDENKKMITSDIDFMETWKGMEECLELGLTKSLGVSNFNSKQIERIFKEGTVKPVNLQVECHPYLNQSKLIEFCRANGMAVTAYSPLGSPDRPMAAPHDPILMEEPKLKEIADKHKKSIAQVLIRYQVQRGVIVIPKSINKERLEANINVFDFELSTEDMDTLNNIGHSYRYLSLDWMKDHKYYPFKEPF